MKFVVWLVFRDVADTDVLALFLKLKFMMIGLSWKLRNRGRGGSVG